MRWGRAFVLIALVTLTWFTWRSKAVYPVRIFVTFLHEMGHAAGTLATGGKVLRITISPDTSGKCLRQGGWDIVVIPAGYLGSMLFGTLILLAASRTRFRKATSFLLGLVFLACVTFYVRSMFDFFFGLAWGVALASAGWWLPEDANDLLLSYLGTASCLFAVFDLRDLWRLGSAADTDAGHFSEKILPLPPRVWAALWAAVAVVWALAALRAAVRSSRSSR